MLAHALPLVAVALLPIVAHGSPLTTTTSEPNPPPPGPDASATILVPAIHPDVDPSDVKNLHLGQGTELFYTDPSPLTSDVSFATLKAPQMAFPAVVLDHSNLVTVICKGDSMSLLFANPEAFQTAQKHWSTRDSSFIAITSDPDCVSIDGQHEYMQVNGVTFSPEKLGATASITKVNLSHAVGPENPVTVHLGNFNLTNRDRSSGFYSGTHDVRGANSSSVDFDVALDDGIGYLNVSDPAYFPQLYPGITGERPSDFSGEHVGPNLTASAEKRRREFRKRGWFDSVTNVFKTATSSIASAAQNVVKQVASAVKDSVIDKAAEAYDKLNPYTPKIYTPLDTDLSLATPAGKDSTPWGPGLKVFSKTQGGGAISIYCVNCGAQGKLHVKGTITFLISERRVVSGSLSAQGAISAALELGIVASYNNTWSYDREVANIPLSPLSIPGVVTIGPQISLNAGGSLTVQATGQLLAGALLDWPSVQAYIDIGNGSSSSASGFKPNINPVFKVQGSVSATADVYLLLSVGFGIDLLEGTIKKQVALVEKPEISVKASASGQAGYSNGHGSGSTGTAACKGVSLDVDFNNFVYADLGFSQKSIYTVTLPVTSKCIASRRSLSSPNTDVGLTTTNSLNYTELNAADKHGLGLHWADNGNLYAVDANYSAPTANGFDDTLLFVQSVNGTVIGDSKGRLLHGYFDTLARQGVSRLRLADGDHIPKSSVMLTLAPVDPDASGNSVMMAFDSAGHAYFPILCVYNNLYPKLFVATNVAKGKAVLESPDQVKTLTGGSVKECGFFAVTDGSKGENDK